MINILHLTAHIGGGVGKFLSGFIEQSKSDLNFKHTIVCLEKVKDRQFIDIANKYSKVIETPTCSEIENLMNSADIIQVEYWNHPLLIKYLCKLNIPPIRLLVCSHNNGLYNPIVPKKLIEFADEIIFTTECSLDNKKISKFKNKFGVVHTGGGFKERYNKNNDEKISVGYAGSFQFAKLHPEYANFINKINIPNFKVKMIGNSLNKNILETQSNKFEFTGFVSDIYKEFEKINVFAYLLNPKHYGTTENVLIEAMSVGIVPIVLNNPAERCIVEDGKTGFIINSPEDFSIIINFLFKNPTTRINIGLNAMMSVRSKYTVENTVLNFNKYYKKIMNTNKKEVYFKSVFGNNPDEWFISCQGNKYIYKESGEIDLKYVDKYYKYMLYEETKGSLFHFSEYFSDNQKLKLWSENLRRQI